MRKRSVPLVEKPKYLVLAGLPSITPVVTKIPVSSSPSKVIEGWAAVPEAKIPVCALIVVPENDVPVTLVKTPEAPLNVVNSALVPVAVTK